MVTAAAKKVQFTASEVGILLWRLSEYGNAANYERFHLQVK